MASKQVKDDIMEDHSGSESTMEQEDVAEAVIRDEVQLWLDHHGSKLFALECSKWLAMEKRRTNIASKR